MNAHASVISDTLCKTYATAHDYHQYQGWLFRRRDFLRVELFQVAQCEYCDNEISHSQLIVAEQVDELLIDAGLKPALAPKLTGDRVFEDGPYLCAHCTREWREGKIGIACAV